jgi:ketosteroid isomerase-like protein
MSRLSIVFLTGTLLLSAVGSVSADTTADLITLDKQWGAAGTKGDATAVAKLLADDVVAVDENGVSGKQQQIADAKPDPDVTQYEPTDYKVTLLDKDTAIMTHGTKGKDSHQSLHVWSRKTGQWQVVATSTTPTKKSK